MSSPFNFLQTLLDVFIWIYLHHQSLSLPENALQAWEQENFNIFGLIYLLIYFSIKAPEMLFKSCFPLEISWTILHICSINLKCCLFHFHERVVKKNPEKKERMRQTIHLIPKWPPRGNKLARVERKRGHKGQVSFPYFYYFYKIRKLPISNA